MADQLEQAKRPVTALAGPYGHPFHPLLVTVPIGVWVASLVFDIASHIDSNPGFLTEGSRWLIAIGVIGALIAALLGFLDLLAIPRATKAFRTGLIHMGLNLAVTVAYVVNYFWRESMHGRGDPVAAGPLILSIFSLLALGVSGYLGGKLAYRYGVRVAAESIQLEGYASNPAPSDGEPRQPQ